MYKTKNIKNIKKLENIEKLVKKLEVKIIMIPNYGIIKM